MTGIHPGFDDPAFYGDRWAAVYDDHHQHANARPAVEFLAGLAGDGRVLELAIGTGRGGVLGQPVRRGPQVQPRPGASQRPAAFGAYLRCQAGIRHATAFYVLTLAGGQICAMTRFEASVLPWFGLPRSVPSR